MNANVKILPMCDAVRKGDKTVSANKNHAQKMHCLQADRDIKLSNVERWENASPQIFLEGEQIW